MMKIAVLLSLATSANAFVHPSPSVGSPTALASAVENKHNEQSAVVSSTRQAFLGQVATSSAALVAASFLGTAPPALATGRATLDVTYRRYAPRIRAGGEFYGGDFKSLVANNDWKGIQGALREVPERQKKDLSKSDGGVAERARQAGAFSDARVLVAGRFWDLQCNVVDFGGPLWETKLSFFCEKGSRALVAVFCLLSLGLFSHQTFFLFPCLYCPLSTHHTSRTLCQCL
mmetsp:Transcript_14974/g.30871  ORF Transcript_14974/g.30871 Transcript_14974/m.30871 type:complete len:231 (-) Transcript_14974:572-1264(-)